MIKYIVPRDRVPPLPKTATVEFLLSAHHSTIQAADGKAGRRGSARTIDTKNNVSGRRGSAPRGRRVEPPVKLPSTMTAIRTSVLVKRKDPETGEKWVNGYKKVARLGEGTFGKVSLYSSNKRLYAIKVSGAETNRWSVVIDCVLLLM